MFVLTLLLTRVIHSQKSRVRGRHWTAVLEELVRCLRRVLEGHLARDSCHSRQLVRVPLSGGTSNCSQWLCHNTDVYIRKWQRWSRRSGKQSTTCTTSSGTLKKWCNCRASTASSETKAESRDLVHWIVNIYECLINHYTSIKTGIVYCTRWMCPSIVLKLIVILKLVIIKCSLMLSTMSLFAQWHRINRVRQGCSRKIRRFITWLPSPPHYEHYYHCYHYCYSC